MIAALLGAVLIFFASKLLCYTAVIRFTSGERDYSDTCDKITHTFIQLLTGGFIIGMVEATVAINHVDLSKGTLNSSGQLIPLLIGAMTLLLVVLSYLRWLAGHFSDIHAIVKYTENVSRISDRIEKFIAKRVNIGPPKGLYTQTQGEDQDADINRAESGTLPILGDSPARSGDENGRHHVPAIVIDDVEGDISEWGSDVRRAASTNTEDDGTMVDEDDSGELSYLISRARDTRAFARRERVGRNE